MAKRKLKKGVCKICKETTLLNFEHVPPRSAFNKNTKYKTINFHDYLKSLNPLDYSIKGKVEQGGIGYYCYCEKCNNFLGTEYVREYKEWAICGVHILANGRFDRYDYDIIRINPNKILKQIISMFIAMNEEWFGNEYSDLIEFVKKSESIDLDNRFHVYMYLNTGAKYRYVNFMVKGSLEGGPIKCMELAFPPYGYVLTIDEPATDKRLTEITYFKNFNKEHDLELSIHRLETHLPFPMDYRTKSEIKSAMNLEKQP